MQAIKNKNTKIESILSKALWHKGFRFRKNNSKIFGKPDLSLKKYKIAIFCDSEFFHGKDWATEKHRIKSNIEFWHKKIESNISRDEIVNNTLSNSGWIVVRFWGEEIHHSLTNCVNKIEKLVEKQKNQHGLL